jgi:hypothetical protein
LSKNEFLRDEESYIGFNFRLLDSNFDKTGHASFEIKMVQKNVDTIRLQNSKNEDAKIYSRIWNFVKFMFSFDILE